MSTKTTFKRVALVTVAAMGFGLLSVAPSTATTQSDTLTLGSATSTMAAGSTSVTNTITQAFLGLNSDTMSVTMTLTSSPTGNAVMPEFNTVVNESANGGSLPVRSTDKLAMTFMDTGSVTVYHSVSSKHSLTFAPTLVGTYVITFTAHNLSSSTNGLVPSSARSTVVAAAAPVTWTVTVSGGTTADATTTSILTQAGVAVGSADKTIRVAAGSAQTSVATVYVTPLIDYVATTGSTQFSAVITGPGLINASSSSTAATTSGGLKSATYAGTAAGLGYVHVYGDGTTGTSTITITVGGTTKTETVYFYGAAASVTTTTTTPVIDSGSGATSTAILTATVKDANGNVVPGVTVYAVSGTTTVFASSSATTGSAGTAVISALGLVAGTSAVTVQNVATGSTATYSAAAVSIRAGSITGASVVFSLDKATYAQGEAAVLTVTVKDAAGNAVADSSNTYASAVTSSKAVTGSLPSGVHVTTGSNLGVLTYAINVPSTSGAFTITATAGSGWTGTFTATATVSPSAAETAAAAAIAAAADIASAAVDAAAEATDAANAATDAANAAAEAADAATAAAQDAADAIASLATAVAELMADLKAQISAQKAAITALTNLVIKIQKKVKA